MRSKKATEWVPCECPECQCDNEAPKFPEDELAVCDECSWNEHAPDRAPYDYEQDDDDDI